MVGLTRGGIDTRIMRFVRRAFISLNLLIISICFLGLAGVFKDSGEAFTVCLEVISKRVIPISKRAIAIAIAFNLLVPVIYYGISPCQRNEETLAVLNKKQKRGEHV